MNIVIVLTVLDKDQPSWFSWRQFTYDWYTSWPIIDTQVGQERNPKTIQVLFLHIFEGLANSELAISIPDMTLDIPAADSVILENVTLSLVSPAHRDQLTAEAPAWHRVKTTYPAMTTQAMPTIKEGTYPFIVVNLRIKNDDSEFRKDKTVIRMGTELEYQVENQQNKKKGKFFFSSSKIVPWKHLKFPNFIFILSTPFLP